jgi:hypothetical protein
VIFRKNGDKCRIFSSPEENLEPCRVEACSLRLRPTWASRQWLLKKYLPNVFGHDTPRGNFSNCGGVGTLEPYLYVHVKEIALVAYGGMVNT